MSAQPAVSIESGTARFLLEWMRAREGSLLDARTRAMCRRAITQLRSALGEVDDERRAGRAAMLAAYQRGYRQAGRDRVPCPDCGGPMMRKANRCRPCFDRLRAS